MARQTSGLTVCKWKTKSMYGMVFVPEPCVSFAQMRSIYWKGACKSWKQVSKMSIEQIDGEFPFGTFGWNKQDYMYFFYMFCCFWKCTFQATTPESVGKWKGHVSLPPHWKHEHVAQLIRPSLGNSKNSCLSLFFMLIVAIHLMDNRWKPKLNP